MPLWAYIVPLVMSEGGVAATTRMMNCLHKCSEFLMTPTLGIRCGCITDKSVGFGVRVTILKAIAGVETAASP